MLSIIGEETLLLLLKQRYKAVTFVNVIVHYCKNGRTVVMKVTVMVTVTVKVRLLQTHK